MKQIQQILGVLFAILLAFQLVYAAGHGYGLHNGVGTALQLAILAGLIGLFAVNILGIITSGGATLAVSNERMQNAFFFTALTVGILFSMQAIITLSGSSLVFIPTILESILNILVVGGMLAWMILAGIFWIGEALNALSNGVARRYGWLIIAVMLGLGFLFYYAFRDGSIFSFSKEDALFAPTKQEVTIPTTEPNAQKAKGSAGASKAEAGGRKAETEKQTEQTITDANGVKVTQKIGSGNVSQHIVDDAEPDGH